MLGPMIGGASEAAMRKMVRTCSKLPKRDIIAALATRSNCQGTKRPTTTPTRAPTTFVQAKANAHPTYVCVV